MRSLNTGMNKSFKIVLAESRLSASGAIPNFSDYKEIVVIINSNGLSKSYYMPMEFLKASSSIILANFWQYEGISKGYATIKITNNGEYHVGNNIPANSENSSVYVLAK